MLRAASLTARLLWDTARLNQREGLVVVMET